MKNADRKLKVKINSSQSRRDDRVIENNSRDNPLSSFARRASTQQVHPLTGKKPVPIRLFY
ncbi:MAG: hypothetical protein JXA03_08050 [Bacteroidales bacterium]|nr:hypothetical protein [Bacteroidales bacterium]